MAALADIAAWLDRTLRVAEFDDVSNNGLQLARSAGEAGEVARVAFAVDASLASVRAAAEAGAQLLVVHHGISWGGGIRRIAGGVYNVVRAAVAADLAIYAAHLPLDAHKRYGNNWELARYLGLKDLRPAFAWHGQVIGVTGVNPQGCKVGICSGGAGDLASEARRLGCALYVTGEASWGERVAAANIGMPMVCAGHYETETFGVKALMKAVRRALRVSVTFVSLLLAFVGTAAEGAEFAAEGEPARYAGAAGALVLPQGGSRLRRLGGGAFRAGRYVSEAWAIEGEAAALEEACGLAVRAVGHWTGWSLYGDLFGYERYDPFVTLGASGWIGREGQVGPSVGVGCFYHLDDSWSLRAGWELTLGLGGAVETAHALSVGVQYRF